MATILVVGWEDITDVLGQFLEGEGYEVSVSTSAPDALEMLRRGARPDVLIALGITALPGMDGEAFCSALYDDPDARTVPVILGAARTSEELARLPLTANVVVRLPMPFSAEALLAAMVAAITAGDRRPPTT